MNKRIQKTVALVGLLTALTACGGGGGGGGNSPIVPVNPVVYSLAKVKSTAVGTVYSAQLTGTDSNNGQWSGSIAIVNRPQISLNGVMATPQDSTASLTYQGASSTSTTTTYIDGAGFTLGSNSGGTVCVPVTPFQLPDTVEIGDADADPLVTCDNSTSSQSSWKVEKADNGNANLVLTEDLKDASSTTVGNSVTTLTINAAGDILAYQIVLSTTGTPTVTLHNTQ